MAIFSDGQKIGSTYEVERFLGQGAFAEVYRVRHRFLGRQAMKVFKRLDMTEAEVLEALSEAILLTQLKHPNIVSVHEANVYDSPRGRCGWFTMEYVSGGSLERFWKSHGAAVVPVETTVDIMRQVCRGLAVAHANNPPIIHRDIKPQNILVGYETEGLRARISDFGLAKKVNPLTLLATAAGTLAFKPPETFHKSKADSCAADVWAIGVTMYLLFTDQLPFEIDPTLGWSKNNDKPLVPPGTWNSEVDPALEKIVLQCLKMEPEDRYPTARELLAALEGWRKPEQPKNLKPKAMTSSELSKSVFGTHTPVDSDEGQRLVRQAFERAKDVERLSEAADILEEAFNKSPSLRQKYANRVRLWRCGISG